MNSCNKNTYFTQIYDKELVNKKIKCLKLRLFPYSNEVFDTINKLYNFDDNCNYILEIKHKTNIYCNSNYNTNKQYHSFIQLNILVNKKLIFTIYKDLKDEDIKTEIIKGYKELCKTIKL